LLGAEGRIQQLRQSMTQVADYADASGDQVGEFKEEAMARVYEIARAALDRDDAVEEAARALPAQRKTAIDARANAEGDRKTARGALDDCERAMAKLATLASYAQERDEAANAVTEGEAARARAQSELLAHEGASDAARRALVEAQGAVSALAVERETFRPLAARAVALANAEARIAELEMERAEVRTEEAQIAGERSAIVLPEPLGVTLSVLEGEARTARENLSRSGVLRSLAEQDVATRQSVAASDDAADWTLLGESLGRDGLQAILIDAAGPELTELVNDLLHTCHGPRFSMRIEASRTSADGKKVLDGCEVTVTDAKEGREAPGETFSGGEQAILNEALGLALTVLTCRRSGASRPTLIRDEPTAALDPENGLAYAAMLRRAASYVSAHKILFVTHQAAIAELADGRVDLDGRTSPDAA
jgi:exonuclease SbcC